MRLIVKKLNNIQKKGQQLGLLFIPEIKMSE